MKTIAVIGLGSIAARHRANLKRLYPDCIIFSMSSSGRAPKDKISNSDTLASCIDELLSAKVGLAIVASPASYHASHALPFIKAGIPTFIEKPLSASLDDCRIIADAVKAYSTRVCVGYCLRYLPTALKLKQAIESRIIGEVYNVYSEVGQYLPDWRKDKLYKNSVSARADLGGGALLELSHEFDYLQWIFGKLDIYHSILRVSDELGLEVEDCADVVAVSHSTVVNIHLDFLQKKAYRKCRIIGSLGVLEWDLIGNSLTLCKSSVNEVLYCDSEWDKNKMYLHMLTDFLESPQDDVPLYASINQALNSVELIEKIKMNAKWVKKTK